MHGIMQKWNITGNKALEGGLYLARQQGHTPRREGLQNKGQNVQARYSMSCLLGSAVALMSCSLKLVRGPPS